MSITDSVEGTIPYSNILFLLLHTHMAKKTTLFNALYTGLVKTVKLINQPLVERAVKRRFDSFIDGCLSKIDEKQMLLNQLREDGIKSPEHMDLNAICKARLDIVQARDLAEIAEEEKNELFSVNVNVDTTDTKE